MLAIARVKRWAVAAAAALAVVLVAADAPPVQDWSSETVTVSVHRRGPLFWRASRGSAEVWLLAVVGPMPDGLSWDKSGLEAVIDGAKMVWLQPRAEVGLFEGVWFLLARRDALELPEGGRLESTLPPALKDRFVAARTGLGRSAGRYEDYVPAWAGIMLYSDFLERAKMTAEEPGDTVERLAARQDIPVRPIASYEALPVIEDIGKMPEAQSLACLGDALDDIDAEARHQVPAAQGWASGDLAAMKANYSESTIFACLQQMPSFSALWDRSVADSTKAIDQALAGDGKTVMVASLGALLRKGGILDRLRDEGVRIDAPD